MPGNDKGNLKFAVIGAGHAGRAMSAHLSHMGYEVNLYNRTREKILPLIKNGGIRVHGAINGFSRLRLITSDIQQAIENVDVIMVTVPASGHRDIATAMAPYLKSGQTIILNPGRTFGCLEFSSIIQRVKPRLDVTLAEAQTIVYTTRHADDSVEIFGLKNKVSLAAFPAYKTSDVIGLVRDVYPQFTAEKNVLKTGLDNIGAIFHPTPTLLNVGWIESKKTPFKYYYEAITPSVAQIIERIDQERVKVARAIGVDARSAREWLKEAYGVTGKNLYEAIQNNDKYATIDAPTTINHRYIFEDVPTGMVPIASLGKKIGVETPCIDMMIRLASTLFRTDFGHTGRSLENLGLSGLNTGEIQLLVDRGYEAIGAKELAIPRLQLAR